MYQRTRGQSVVTGHSQSQHIQERRKHEQGINTDFLISSENNKDEIRVVKYSRTTKEQDIRSTEV